MNLDFAANWAQILSLFLPFVLAWLGWTAKKWVQEIVRDMRKDIQTATAPIQKNANGGFSLPDAIRKLDNLDGKLSEIHYRITDVQTNLAHLQGRFEQHIEEQP